MTLWHVLFCTVIPELTLNVLTKELKCLTEPILFGIGLDIPQDVMAVIQRDHRHGECIYIPS